MGSEEPAQKLGTSINHWHMMEVPNFMSAIAIAATVIFWL